MPVTRRDHVIRSSTMDFEPALGSVDTPGFLFGDEFKNNTESSTSSRPTSGFLSMQQNGDNFPVLIRSQGDTKKQISTGHDGLELALSHSLDQESNSSGWPTSFSRPNTSHSTMPTTGAFQSSGDLPDMNSSATNRHSMGAKMTFTETKRPNPMNLAPAEMSSDRMPTKLQTSFSTSSVPTVSSLSGLNGHSAQMLPMSSGGFNNSSSGTHPSSVSTAEQRLHQHNVSLGRIPTGAMNSNRQSRDFAGLLGAENTKIEGQINNLQSAQSGLHPGAASFGPSTAESAPSSVPNTVSNYPAQGYGMGFGMGYGMGYGMYNNGSNQLNDAMQALSMKQPASGQWSGQSQNFQPPQGYGANYRGYQYNGGNRQPDNQSRMMQQRRSQNGNDGKPILSPIFRLRQANQSKQMRLVLLISRSRISKERFMAYAQTNTVVVIFRRSSKTIIPTTSS